MAFEGAPISWFDRFMRASMTPNRLTAPAQAIAGQAPAWDHAMPLLPASASPVAQANRARGRTKNVIRQMMKQRGPGMTMADVLRPTGSEDAGLPRGSAASLSDVVRGVQEAPGEAPGASIAEKQAIEAALQPQALPEPVGDAGIYEFALTQPDLLERASSGQMTSLELLQELLKRRAAGGAGGPGPMPGGGFY